MHIRLYTGPPYELKGPLEQGGNYRHIVGISFEEEQFWRPDQRYYKEGDTEDLEITDRDFGLRLVSFFKAYVTHVKRHGPEYNCHIFAAHMTGTIEQDSANDSGTWDRAADMARGIVDQGAKVDRLPFGVQGVLAQREDPYVRHIAHSAIGLGEDREEFLEVHDTYGDLGIQRYSRSLPHYAVTYQTNGLYALPAGTMPQSFSRG